MKYIVRKQRLCLNMKNTQKGGGGWIGFLKSFQSQQIQTQYKQNKEIELENSNSGFIVTLPCLRPLSSIS